MNELTINMILSRNWWDFGKIRKYIKPIKTIDKIEYYDMNDVRIIETMNDLNILSRKVKFGTVKKGGIKYRSQNIANLLDIKIKNVDLKTAVKKMKRHKKSVRNIYKKKFVDRYTNPEKNTLAYIRHNYTNYEELIYYGIGDIEKNVNVSIDKNTIVKKLKKLINSIIYQKYPLIKKIQG